MTTSTMSLLESFKDLASDVFSGKILDKMDKKVTVGLAAIGAYTLFKSYGLRPAKLLWEHVLRPRKDFVKSYGKGWALITGASKGIGKEYCY
jgi:hypothetical protein